MITAFRTRGDARLQYGSTEHGLQNINGVKHLFLSLNLVSIAEWLWSSLCVLTLFGIWKYGVEE